MSLCCKIRHTSSFSVAANHLKVPFQRVGFGYVLNGRRTLEAVKYANDSETIIAVYENMEWRRAYDTESWTE